MKKISTQRLVSSGLLSILFLAEMFLLSTLLGSYPTSSFTYGHILYVASLFLLPVAAIVITLPVFENENVKRAFSYAGLLYACACAVSYSSTATLFAASVQAQDATLGYYFVAAKVILVLFALLLAGYAKKEGKAAEEVSTVCEECGDCAEATAEELTNAEAAQVLSEEKSETV